MAQTKKKARFRLTDLRTQAVGIVDVPANGQTWLTMKSSQGAVVEDEKDKTISAEDPVAEPEKKADPPAGVVMSSAHQSALSDLLAQVLTSLSAVAESVQSATIDDAAPVPADLIMQIDAVADGLDESIESLMPEMAEGDPAMDLAGDMEAQKAKAPMPGRKRRLMAVKRMKAMAECHKAIGEGHALVGKGMEGIQKVMSELGGGAPEKSEKSMPVDMLSAFEAANKSILDAMSKFDIQALVAEVKKALAPNFASLQAMNLRVTSAITPRAAPIEPVVPEPSSDGESSYSEMLERAKQAR